MEIELTIGDYLTDVKCENFHDREAGRVRVRPLPNQGLSTDLVIECSKQVRERYPLGTRFTTENVKVCVKSDGRVYLRAKDQMIYKI